MTPLTDEALIPGLEAGDEATTQVLIDRYWARAYRVALDLVGGDPGLAEDVTQEAFVAALGAIDGFREGARLRPWLFGILQKKASNARRARGRRTHHEHRRAEAASLGLADAERDAARSESRQQLRAELFALDEPLRDVLSLRYLEGLSLAEVAEALEIPEGTVSSRARRGLGQLRERLDPALAELAVLAPLPWLQTLLGEGPGDLPGAPAAVEVLAPLRAGPRPTPVPPPAPRAPALLARARPGAVVGAMGLIALGVSAVVFLDPAGESSRAEPPGWSAGAPRETFAAGAPANAPAQEERADSEDPLAPPPGAAQVAFVGSGGAALVDAWIAPLALDDDALRKGTYARDNDAARAVGRLYAGYSIPEGATGVARSDGRLGLDLPPGRHRVAVGARGCPTQVHWLQVPGELRVELAPVEPARLRLELVDDRGRPYAWEPLRLGLRAGEGVPPLVVRHDEAPTPAPSPEAEQVLAGLRALLDGLISLYTLDPIEADGDGAVELELAPGTYSVVGWAEGAQGAAFDTPERGVELTLAPGQQASLTLATERPEGLFGSVALRVVDRAGRPVPRARYRLLTAGNGYLERAYHERVGEVIQAHERGKWYDTTVGPDGTRLIRGVALGSLALMAREGFWGGRSARMTLERERQELAVEVVLDEALAECDLALRLLDADAAPITSELQFAFDHEGGASSYRTEGTDVEGIARFEDLDPGRYRVTVWGAGFAPCDPLSLELQAGEHHALDLRLERGAVLSGRVTAAQAPAGTRIGLTLLRDGPRELRGSFSLQGETDPQGRFRFAGLPPDGEFRVETHNVPGYADRVFGGLGPGSDVELVLPDGPVYAFEVVDAEGQPLPGMEVTVGSDGRRASALTDAEGRALLRGDLAHDYGYVSVGERLGARERRYQDYHETLEPLPAGLERRVVLQREAPERPPVRVRGRATRPDGTPLAGASVGSMRLRRDGGGSGPSGRTDADGRFELEAESGGVLVLRVELGRWFADARVPLEAGRERHAELVATAGVQVAGTLVGSPGGWLRLEARQLDGSGVEVVELGHSTRAGDVPFSLGYLAPGTWTFELVEHGRQIRVRATTELTLQPGVDELNVVLDAR